VLSQRAAKQQVVEGVHR
jgi:hypothetical protein